MGRRAEGPAEGVIAKPARVRARRGEVPFDQVVRAAVPQEQLELLLDVVAGGAEFPVRARGQDADVILFIYRDEVYNPDTDRKNIADIIVAKHRNGPVGQISLYFQAAQTRYRDLELRTPDY